MTISEWLVIAAAAVIFVLANIIMWSIIAEKEKRAKEADIRNDASPIGMSRTIVADRRPVNPPAHPPQHRTSNFTIKENTVIIHTDERIEP